MNRAQNLLRLQDESFDLAVIGGGATGLGTALDAASRGYRVALVEGQDFAKGTSSRSTKLVHGGVRYLAHGNVGLVREALRERGRLRHNAPHLVGDLEFVVPAYAWWNGPYYGVGIKLYDVLAGKKYRLGASRFITRSEVLERVPNLEGQELRGGIVYFDGQFDDARLAVAIAQTAGEQGAALVNYAPAVALLKDNGRIRGLVARDEESGREIPVRAKAVVNATGVFAESIRQLDEPGAPASMSPSQGVHLVLPKKFFPGKSALVVPKTDDGRVAFIVPWHGRALLGTTDTPVEQVSYEPRPLEQEVDFLMQLSARYLEKDPDRSDVLSTFAGLRPLVRQKKEDQNTGALSRDHHLFVSKSGLVTIVGGKWTTYRKMAEDTVDRAIKIADLPFHPCVTAGLRLHGAKGLEAVHDAASEAPAGVVESYGTDAAKLERLMVERPELREPLHPDLPYLAVSVVWAVREEMARTLEDVMARRTRALLLDARASLQAAPAVAQLMAKELGRDEAWAKNQLAAFRAQGERCLL